MKILLNQQRQRIPNKSVYTFVLTLILAFAVVWIIYSSVPYSHYSLYLIEPNVKNTGI